MDWKLIALGIIAVLIIVLVPYSVISSDDIAQKAEEVPEVQLFKTMYPDAVIVNVEEMACVKKYFDEYIRDTSAPLTARQVDYVCFEEEKDWVVTYSATGIVDTPGLSVGVNAKDGSIIDAAFTSPYDDVHVLNYSFITTAPVIETILNNSGIVSRSGWTAFEEDGTKYLTFTITYPEKTTVLVYIESTPEYGNPTAENFRSEVDAAHGKFETGAKKFSSLLRKGFTQDFNVSSYYLFFPTPVVTVQWNESTQ